MIQLLLCILLNFISHQLLLVAGDSSLLSRRPSRIITSRWREKEIFVGSVHLQNHRYLHTRLDHSYTREEHDNRASRSRSIKLCALHFFCIYILPHEWCENKNSMFDAEMIRIVRRPNPCVRALVSECIGKQKSLHHVIR